MVLSDSRPQLLTLPRAQATPDTLGLPLDCVLGALVDHRADSATAYGEGLVSGFVGVVSVRKVLARGRVWSINHRIHKHNPVALLSVAALKSLIVQLFSSLRLVMSVDTDKMNLIQENPKHQIRQKQNPKTEALGLAYLNERERIAR